MTADDGHGQLTAWHGRPWFAANEVLAFVLELGVLGALAWWGFTAVDGALVSAVLGIGTPAAAAVLWGLFAAPRARFRGAPAGAPAVKALVLGGGAAAVYGVGHPVAAVVLAVVLVVNTACAEYFRGRAASEGPVVS
ncbi:YrdB family protein [Streptomyces salyersiae]|uniref:YrdB family protein n=1 Tax=Streptomyces salyersiae TaxID=3075530 RepID=A0ABU2RXQ7_9ACTN|nr:YrdB family protein [Streptomyces sp. DSM 41770]MDT0432709.1 YrdB family protein [Streptomyces sp. DSM 41770]